MKRYLIKVLFMVISLAGSNSALAALGDFKAQAAPSCSTATTSGPGDLRVTAEAGLQIFDTRGKPMNLPLESQALKPSEIESTNWIPKTEHRPAGFLVSLSNRQAYVVYLV